MQQKIETSFLLYLNLMNFKEVKWNLTEVTTRSDCDQLLSVVLLYLRMCQIPCALDCRACLSVWQEEGALHVEHLAVPPTLFSTVYKCDECLSSQKRGDS